MVSIALPQSSQMNQPRSSVGGGPVAPERKRDPQAPQSVAGPLGPGFLPEHWSMVQLHQSQRHLPPSQRRLWEARATMVVSARPHSHM